MNPKIHQLDLTQEFETSERCWITELANDPNDPEVSIARARVAPGVTTQWHWLKQTSERYVVLEGSGLAEVADLPATQLGPGDCVVIPPNCRQRITNNGDQDLVFLAICAPRFRLDCYVSCDQE